MVYGKPPLHALPFLIDLRFLYFWRSDLPNLQRELQKSNNARDTFWRNLRSARAAPGKFPFAIPTAREWELMHHLALLVWGHGGQLVETHGRHSTPAFVEPGLRGAIFLRNLVKEGLLDLPSVTREDLEQKFLEKQVSSIISGPWLMEQIQKKYPEQPWNELVGVALPALYGSPETAVTFQGGTMLGVTGARRSLQVAALKLARHLTQSADTLTWTSAEGLVPAAPGLRGGPEGVVVHWSPASSDRHCSTYFQCLAEGSSDPAVLQVVQQAIKVGRGYPAIPKWWDIEVKTSPRLIFHFFQELAELKSEDALKADLQAIASEWEQILGDQQQPTSALPWVGMCFVAAAFVTWLWNIRRTRERLNSITAKTPSSPLQPAPAVSMPLGQEVTARITASQGFSIPALEEAIRISGYSIEEVAARLDLDEKNLRKILHGEVKKPTAKTRRKLEAFIEDPRNCRFKRDVT